MNDHHVALRVFDAGFDLLHELVDVIVTVIVGVFEADGEFELYVSEEVRRGLERRVGIFPFFLEGFHYYFMDLLAGHRTKEPYEDISFLVIICGIGIGGYICSPFTARRAKKGKF